MTDTPDNSTAENWQQELAKLAQLQGFALAGVTKAQPADHQNFFRKWLSDRRHGEMDYLARNVEIRLDPAKLLAGAKSVIVVADRYPAEFDAGDRTSGNEHRGPTGQIARYAWGDDYHKTIKKRLFALADGLKKLWPGAEFRAAVDTAPIFERQHAERAGLGWIGKHTLLINQELGSWLLLGVIVTTLEVESQNIGCHDSPDKSGSSVQGSHCGTCTRCIDACPTKCISPYQIDASQCISYLTLEHRSEIDSALHKDMGDWLAGCDVCQQVCPFNVQASNTEKQASYQSAYTPRPPAPAVDLLSVLNWSEDDRRSAVRKSALKRVKLEMFRRNALIAAGNWLMSNRDDALLAKVKSIAGDDAELAMVKQTAKQVIGRLEQAAGNK